MPDSQHKTTKNAQNTEETYWIALGDIHDKNSRLSKIPGLRKAQGVIVSGDLTLTGGPDQARKALEPLIKDNIRIFAQIGNMDRPEVTQWLIDQGWNLHCELHELAPDTVIMGVGASTFTPFGTPSEYPESWFAHELERLWHSARKYKHVILVSHNPPKNTVCDDIGGGNHVGSMAVREFIEENQPDICICGHIHEGVGTDLIGHTVVTNPGAFLSGGYLTLRLTANGPAVELGSLI
jgi:Icc-related predicted phosphoesterase